MPTVKPRPKSKPVSKLRKSAPLFATVGDLLERLGGISAHRVCADPPPGTATVADYARRNGRTASGTLCELVDGTFVEKPMGSPESVIATEIIGRLWVYLAANPVGFMGGEGYFVRVGPQQVSVADGVVVLWKAGEPRRVKRCIITDDVPALVFEIPKPSNTKAEITRKLAEFFAAGTLVAWVVDSRTGTAEIYTSATDKVAVPRDGVLTAEAVLPGFALPLATAFAWLPKATPRGRKP